MKHPITIERNRIGINQSKLARIMGVTKQTVCAWELGKSSPRIYHLRKLADYFGVTIDYLLSHTDKTEPA
jgi:transcriptional regulator with XRE-family HTH domain